MTKIKLVISDIDGTLLNSKHEVTPEAIQIIQDLVKQDTKIILASARPPGAMVSIADEVQLSSPLVCFNGALITQYTEGSFVYLYSLTLAGPDTLQIYQTVSTKFPEISFNVYSGARWYVEREDEWVKQEASITKMDPESISMESFLNELVPVHKILCMGSPADIQKLEEELAGSNLSSISYYRSKDTYMEIVNNQVSKLGALNFLCEKYGVALENTLANGDNFNDMPMIIHAGKGIAMGNAPDEVKQAADYITGTNDENGFYKALVKSLR
jgi:Cof subfamily protein (haloacid dehalogenase superfamily)